MHTAYTTHMSEMQNVCVQLSDLCYVFACVHASVSELWARRFIEVNITIVHNAQMRVRGIFAQIFEYLLVWAHLWSAKQGPSGLLPCYGRP